MANLQDLAQKISDQTAALNNLSSSVDVLKSNGGKLNAADQAVLDSAVAAVDQNATTIAAIQTKVNNP